MRGVLKSEKTDLETCHVLDQRSEHDFLASLGVLLELMGYAVRSADIEMRGSWFDGMDGSWSPLMMIFAFVPSLDLSSYVETIACLSEWRVLR
jgi:hypothetical protein